MGSSIPDDGVEEISPRDAWARLADDPSATLIDVRTRAEWAYVGIPDLARLSKEPVLIEWQSFPDGVVNPQFTDQLSGLFARQGRGPDDQLMFLCRSGARSWHAASAMIATTAFKRCSNVTDGFEGPLDEERHRGRLAGWKAAGLPWKQG